jgi:hypothetical protein
MNGTVRALFHRLEESGIRYALLRNYEQLCDHPHRQAGQAAGQATDIDLVVASEDISRLRNIAISLAEEFGWDALTECEHFTQSRQRAHHIEIFRFYRHSDASFLQIDLFHAYLIWGLPFMSEREMLADRVQDAGRGLTRIDPFRENTFRLLQIQGLIGSKHTDEKTARYRDRVLTFDSEHGHEFRRFLDSQFAGGAHSDCASRILDALEREDWPCYARTVRRAKAGFWMRFLLRDPRRAVQLVSARLFESRKRHFTNPCGRVLDVHADSPRTRTRLRAILDELKQLNCIDRWSERNSSGVLEQGGLIIRWSTPERAELTVTGGDTSGQIRRWLMDLLVRRHQPLFIRPELRVPTRTGNERLARV